MSIRKLLHIPEGYKIVKIWEEKEREEIRVELEPYVRKAAICSNCGREHKEHPRGRKQITVRDLPVVGQAVYLHVWKRRYRCPKDGKLHVEKVDWIKKKADVPEGMLKKYIASRELRQIKRPDGF